MNDTTLPRSPALKKKAGFLSKILIGFGLIALALAVCVWAGVFYIGVKLPNQRVVMQTPVCSADGVLDKVYGYLTEITENEDGSKTKATEAIDYITALPNYHLDPTCAEVLVRFYYINRDFNNVTRQIDQLDRLEKQGQYPSNRFDGLTSINSKMNDSGNITGRTE